MERHALEFASSVGIKFCEKGEMANLTVTTPEPPVDLLPTHIAAVKNDIEKLSELIEEGAQVEDPKTRETPLHAAAKAGSLKALKWLLENKQVRLTDKSSIGGYTAAHAAAVYGHFDCLKFLLTFDPKRGKELAAMGEDAGLTVLSLAALQGDQKMVEWVLEKFPETVHISNSNGDKVVHFAAAEGHLEILRMLVEKFGKDIVSVEDNRFTTPVFFAAQTGKLNVLDYLINELGEDPVAKDKDGMTSIHTATQNEMVPTVKWLIEKLGPKYILEKTIDGATPLHMAAASGNMEILKFYLENLEDKNDVNTTDNINATPAHDAAEYGKLKAILLLLKYGADISIEDTENKTPYLLAMEQNHSEVAAMIADYQDNGPQALERYEKKRSRPSRDNKRGPRTSQQEAEELSNVIQKSAKAMDNFREKQLKRQESLSKMNEVGMEADDNEDNMNRRRNRQRTDEEDSLDRKLGPRGDLYTVPSKKLHGKQRVRGGGGRSHQNSDIEDFMSETMSHRSYTGVNRGQHFRGGSFDDDPPYAAMNHETASNYSRPSRVKRYQDTDSDISGITGRSDYLYDGRVQGFYPPGYNPVYPPSLPPPRGKKKRPMTPSSKSSQHSGSQYHGQSPMAIPPAQYGYGNPAMFYGYHPQMYPGYPQPGRMIPLPQHHHQAMMQGYSGHGGPRPGPAPVFMALPAHMRQYGEQKPSRRKSLTEKKKNKKAPESKSSSRKPHTDQNIGYGPALDMTDSGHILESKDEDNFHPPAPPLGGNLAGRLEDSTEVLKFDSNFLMAKPGESDMVRHHGGTALNPAKQKPIPYDGRYDKYIMTDSEEEYEVDEFHRVGFAAEVACILAIGCVAGLKGLSKMRKGQKVPPVAGANTTTTADKPSISSAWDVSYEDMPKKKKGKRSRRNSISDVDEAALIGMSVEEFAGREEMGKNNWKKSEKKKQAKGDKGKGKRSAEPEEPQSELLTAELQKQSFQSVSKALGEKILTDTIGARHSSMLNIASSAYGSRMSLNASSADEGDDDINLDDAISMVHGLPSDSHSSGKHHVPVGGTGEEDMEMLLDETKEKHKRKKGKKEKREREGKKEKKDKRSKSRLGSNENIEGTEDVVIENRDAKVRDGVVDARDEMVVEGEDKKDGQIEVEKKGSKEKEEKKKKEKEEKEKKEKEEREKREKEEKKKKEKEEREQKEREEREKKEKEEGEKREKEEKKKEKEEREKREREEKKREKEEREKREKEEKEREREEKRKEKEEKKKEKEEREKREREEKRKEREERRKEREEREKREKEEREKEREEKRKEREEKKKEKEEKKKEKKGEKRPTITPSRPAPSPPKKANENVQQMTKTTEVEVDNDGPIEVENKVFMFDTESEDDEEEEVTTTVKVEVPVNAAKKQTQRDPKVDEIEASFKDITADLNSFLEMPYSEQQKSTKSTRTTAVTGKTVVSSNEGISVDDTKREQSGSKNGNVHDPKGQIQDSVEAESRERSKVDTSEGGFNSQTGNLHFDDISAMAEEMHNFYQEEDLYTYIEGSTPSLSQASYSGIPGEEDGVILVTKDAAESEQRVPTEVAKTTAQATQSDRSLTHSRGTQGNVQTLNSAVQSTRVNVSTVGLQSESNNAKQERRVMESIGTGERVQLSEAGVQNSLQAFMHSTSTQGSLGYTSSFEQNVLATLQGMSYKMEQMKSNPNTTQNEINQQEQVQQEMIESMIKLSLSDPAVMKNLLAMLQEMVSKDTKSPRRRSSSAFEELQSQLLQAQEEQRKESKQHFQTQAEFQLAIQKKLDDQAQSQMMGIESNFEKYARQMQQQIAEQQRRWDEDMKRKEKEKAARRRKRSQDKKHRKHKKINQSSESSLSDSDEGLVQMARRNRPKVAIVPEIKTMQARIYTQNLLGDDDLKTDSQISVAKMKEKQAAKGKLSRMDTNMNFDNSRKAMMRYESKTVHYSEEEEEEEEDDEEMMQFEHIRPITLKRAEIKVQTGTGFTPARPEPHAAGKVGQIRRIESGSEPEQPVQFTKGAGNELSEALQKRLKRK